MTKSPQCPICLTASSIIKSTSLHWNLDLDWPLAGSNSIVMDTRRQQNESTSVIAVTHTQLIPWLTASTHLSPLTGPEFLAAIKTEDGEPRANGLDKRFCVSVEKKRLYWDRDAMRLTVTSSGICSWTRLRVGRVFASRSVAFLWAPRFLAPVVAHISPFRSKNQRWRCSGRKTMYGRAPIDRGGRASVGVRLKRVQLG